MLVLSPQHVGYVPGTWGLIRPNQRQILVVIDRLGPVCPVPEWNCVGPGRPASPRSSLSGHRGRASAGQRKSSAPWARRPWPVPVQPASCCLSRCCATEFYTKRPRPKRPETTNASAGVRRRRLIAPAQKHPPPPRERKSALGLDKEHRDTPGRSEMTGGWCWFSYERQALSILSVVDNQQRPTGRR